MNKPVTRLSAHAAGVALAGLMASHCTYNIDSVHGVSFPICPQSNDPRCVRDPAPGSIATGPPLVSSPTESIMSATLDGQRLAVVVASDTGGAVYSVDTTSGARSLVSGTTASGAARGSGPDWRAPGSIAVAPDGSWHVLSATGVFRVDVATGDRSIVVPIGDPVTCAGETGLLQLDSAGGLAASVRGEVMSARRVGVPRTYSYALVTLDTAGCAVVSWGYANSAAQFAFDGASVYAASDVNSDIARIDLASGASSLVRRRVVGDPQLGGGFPITFGAGELLTHGYAIGPIAIDVATGVETDYGYRNDQSAITIEIAHPAGWPLLLVVGHSGVALFNRARGNTAWLSR